MDVSNRPSYPGPFGGDFTMPPFHAAHENVEAMLRPMSVAPPNFSLNTDEEAAFRIGIGRVDMETRWLAWLDQDILRLWRSWTGFEIYRATFERRANGLQATELLVESSPERFGFEPAEDHGARFAETLEHCLSLIMPRG
jgi:hypothetical protein